MSLSELGKTVAKYAPLLGAVLPIPGGLAIGQAIAAVFGGDPQNTDDLIKRIEGDPDREIKLKEIEATKQTEITRLILADKQSARQREIDYIKATGKTDQTLKYLSFIVTFGFFIALFLLFLPALDVNEQEKNLILVLLGMLASKWQTIIDYYFGSSDKKD
jgi:hypothetical protein